MITAVFGKVEGVMSHVLYIEFKYFHFKGRRPIAACKESQSIRLLINID